MRNKIYSGSQQDILPRFISFPCFTFSFRLYWSLTLAGLLLPIPYDKCAYLCMCVQYPRSEVIMFCMRFICFSIFGESMIKSHKIP